MKEKRKGVFKNISAWLSNTYYIAMIGSLAFILLQASYAKRSVVESNKWEKAKMTIENTKKFKDNMKESPIYHRDVMFLADGLWPDFSVEENTQYADTLLSAYSSLFDSWEKQNEETFRAFMVMDEFAYPIIMGYASEIGSYKAVGGQYYLYSNFIMPAAFRIYPNMGHHAKLLYKLWRARFEQMIVDFSLADPEYAAKLSSRKDFLFLHLDKDNITPAALKKCDAKIKKEIKEIQKEIEKFREENLE